MQDNLPKPDLKDKKILSELDKNARQTNSEIAKSVGLNKNTVNYKIQRMTKEGIITGSYAVIDSSKLGYFSIRTYLKFFNTTQEDEKKMTKWLIENEYVGVVTKIETIHDLGFIIYVKDIYEWETFLSEFKKRFRKYFWNEKVNIFSRVYHYRRNYILGDKKSSEYEIVGGNELAKCDDFDKKILNLLAKDARMSLIDLAQKLKRPERTIAFRIKQLEKKKIIQGYRISLNLDKIGYDYYKINFVLNDCSNKDQIFEFCQNHINVIFIDETLGNWDFEIDVETKGRQELLSLINEIKQKFDIRETEVINFKEYLKLETIPNF